ncbi:MAG: hypothetical protein V4631_10725 [Pseudomonadota bacterium]
MKYQIKIPATVLWFLALTSAAQAAPDRSNEEIKRGVAEVVRRYANAIACPGVKVRPEDVLALIPSEDDDRRLSKYAVLWSGDLGCFGGQGIEATHIAIATISSGKYIVDPRLSSPLVEFDSPVRFVKRVVSYTADTLTLQGNQNGPLDVRGVPSVPVRFVLKLDDKGNWKMFDKRILPIGTAGG